jgi:mannitol-1-/sugar-/sorbitol-6-phosphatase
MEVSHGRRNEETIREIAPHLLTPQVLAEFDASEIRDHEGLSVVDGADELISQLKLHEWALVTSASRELARDRMLSVGLPVPAVLVGADDVARGKPNPEGYLAAAFRLRVATQHCVVFEDTRPGLQAGRAAGMRTFGITTTYSHAELAPAECITNFQSVKFHRADGALQLTLRCL